MASLPEEDMVESLAMLEADEIDHKLRAEPLLQMGQQAQPRLESAQTDVAIMSKLQPLRWVYGKHPPKRTGGFLHFVLHHV